MPAFADRQDAGLALAARLRGRLGDPSQLVVLGLARGGVVVAAQVAAGLGARLDVLVVRKLGHPLRRELGLGALGEGGVRVLNEPLLARLAVEPEDLDAVTALEQRELARRVARYRGTRSPVDLHGRTALVVDDGLATGYSALAAVEVARARGAERIVVAVPVGSPDAVALVYGTADDVVCLQQPDRLRAVGESYHVFAEVGDDEVTALLRAPGVIHGE